MWQQIKSFFLQSRRVWHVLKKPTMAEFKSIAKVAAISILLIGAVGFIITDLMKIVSNVFG